MESFAFWLSSLFSVTVRYNAHIDASGAPIQLLSLRLTYELLTLRYAGQQLTLIPPNSPSAGWRSQAGGHDHIVPKTQRYNPEATMMDAPYRQAGPSAH